MRCSEGGARKVATMSQIEVYRNRDPGPAWCAIGELGDAGYYAGADTREELMALIQEAAEVEGVVPKISMAEPAASDSPAR